MQKLCTSCVKPAFVVCALQLWRNILTTVKQKSHDCEDACSQLWFANE